MSLWDNSHLRVRRILERVKDLLQSHHLPRLLVYRLPNDAIGLRMRKQVFDDSSGAWALNLRISSCTHALAELLKDVVFSEDVLVYLLLGSRHALLSCCAGLLRSRPATCWSYRS
jgi:hypothetical protein